MLEHKKSLNKFKSLKLYQISSVTMVWRSRKKSKDTFRQMKMKPQQPKNQWDTAKAILRGKFTAIQAYLKKRKKSQINNLTLHQKKLGKEQQKKLKVSRRKEIINTRVKINERV